MLDPGLPETLMLEKAIHLKTARINGDEAALEQVIMNIVNNAIDAIEHTGTVTIGLDEDEKRHAYAISIKDDGPGMDDATKARVFEPFFTTKAVGSGTGLGLSMAHGIIEEHGGRIKLESTLGEGTTFTILLPIMQGENDGKDFISGR